VFYREHPELAVHMRDYVTVAAAAVDRQGKTDYVLIAYFWTTFDAHAQTDDASLRTVSAPTTTKAVPDRLILAADDRRIELERMAHSTPEAGIGEMVHAPPGHTFIAGVYRTDLATLRFVAASRHLDLLREANDSDSRYPLWDDQRLSLAAFVQHIEGAP